ncbi:MAG: STAS domain-containing protein [Nitrospirae bacterium]|nr:MAG: STAS domain-containing protein [Nitrospirota bacterium]
MYITEYVHEGSLLLTASGRLTYYSRRCFQAIIQHAEQAPIQHVILDMTGVDGLDSAGIGLLAFAHARLALHGIPLSLVVPHHAVRSILEQVNIPRFIPIYSTCDEALGWSLTSCQTAQNVDLRSR